MAAALLFEGRQTGPPPPRTAGAQSNEGDDRLLFNSIDFLIFFPIVFVSYWLLSRRAQNVLLLVSSYVFYAWWDWRFLGLVVFSSGVDYLVGRGMAASEVKKRKVASAFGVSETGQVRRQLISSHQRGGATGSALARHSRTRPGE